MRAALSGIAMALVCACSMAGAEEAEVRIDQITDVSATAATGMFRFVPDLVRIAPGDSVVFLNSRGEHTVHSIDGLWPDKDGKIAIHSQPEARITLQTPGLYALRCARHGRYGMVMMVVVGDMPDAASVAGALAKARLSGKERAALRALAERAASGG